MIENWCHAWSKPKPASLFSTSRKGSQKKPSRNWQDTQEGDVRACKEQHPGFHAIEYDFIRGATQSPDTCCVCHGRSASPIKRCKNCKLATYCSKDCQVIHWKKSHKKFCSKYSGILSRLSKIDFSDFQSHYDWNFVAPSDLEFQITTLW